MSNATEPPTAPAETRLSWQERLLLSAVFLLGALAALALALPVSVGPLIEKGGATEDVLRRRAYIVRRLQEGGVAPKDIGTQLELFQGEYAFGTYAMCAYALTNIALDAPETRQESLEVLELIVSRIMSKEIRTFDSSQWGEDALATLAGDNGHVAYLGHLNLIMGAYRILGGDDRYDPLHAQITDAIARRLKSVPHFHAETYPHETYTMDNVVAVASLEVADRVRGTDHSDAIQGYLRYTQEHLLDPKTGLIVFGVERATGRPLQRGRGSAAGWASYFLPMIDNVFASEQFDLLRAHLAGSVGPFHGVREYHPSDPNAGYGDIDSGPVLIWGVSATGFSMAGARIHGHDTLLAGLASLSEAFGISIDDGGERRYISSPLLGEAILLSMKTARPWYEGQGTRHREAGK